MAAVAGLPVVGACVIHGDMLAVLPTLAAESISAVVCDPPYHLTSIVKRFGKEGSAPCKVGATGAYARASKGFMGKVWDGGDIAFQPETWAEVLRVMKPGAYLVAFGGTRTAHRMACAIEDAGFEIRDTLCWLYGSGFPKSHDVAKGVDKQLGGVGTFGEPKSAAHAGWIDRGRMRGDDNEAGWQRPWMDDPEQVANAARKYIPATLEAAQWQGWGSALKPAHEPIILARKPLDGTIAANTLKHGCGGINIDACRVGDFDHDRYVEMLKGDALGRDGEASADRRYTENDSTNFAATPGPRGGSPLGRWPANVLHDGSDEVLAAFPAAPGQQGDLIGHDKPRPTKHAFGDMAPAADHFKRNDSGSAARFFYCSKANAKDRAGSVHPTVKPVSLMTWLTKLITPPNGTVLDPFAGSGTTLAAAYRLGFDVIGIEQSAEYVDDIVRRMKAEVRS